jgi:hypothetical protein
MNSGLNFSKAELIAWVQRDLAQPNFSDVKQLHTGAIFAQVLDRMFPGTVKLHRVNFNPTSEQEIVTNWRVVQGGLARNMIERGFDVPKLMLPNAVILLLEALQWLRYAAEMQDKAGELPPYDAEARLRECKLKPMAGK